MATMEERRLDRMLARYDNQIVDDTYIDLYDDVPRFARGFASLHSRLDSEFDFMNFKARNGASGHFNADNSRELLGVIDSFDELRLAMLKASIELNVESEYERVIEGARSWLVASGGSPIPEGFTPVQIEKYAPVFWCGSARTRAKTLETLRLTPVGEGAYANVFKFEDSNYDLVFGLKKLKRRSSAREVERFRREFELMKRFRHPYILDVYKLDEIGLSYTMEFCESTLMDYVRRRNNQPSFAFGFRKRIALQFLYGLNFLHRNGIYHRDLSSRNILLRVYSDAAVTVKLSDFGLAKEEISSLTMSDSVMKGTIRDPALDRFADYGAINDIYAAGFILSYIFDGVERLVGPTSPAAGIVHRCSNSDPALRYQSVRELIRDVERLNP